MKAGFLSFRQSAELEFQASVQLLAERARFLTAADGVAVALKQGEQFVYCAATGDAAPETGTTADITRHPLGECIQTARPARLRVERISDDARDDAAGESSHLAVPVLRDGKVVGFFELLPGACAFEYSDLATATRLSAMVGTALDLLHAAEHTEGLIQQSNNISAPASRVLWHAPEGAPQPVRDPLPHAPADAHPCTACGFPISGVRTRCVDCDAHWDEPKPGPVPLSQLFKVEKQESWIEAHGYTLATLLVSVLAAAIIYWLR